MNENNLDPDQIEQWLDSQSALLLENQLCFSLYRVANEMVRSYRPLLNQLDLTYVQYLVMLVLWEHDQVSVKYIGERLNLDSGTLTPLLKRLEKKQLIERKLSEDDERAKVITLTPNGNKLKNQAKDIPNKMVCQTNLSMQDLTTLKALSDKLHLTINEE